MDVRSTGTIFEISSDMGRSQRETSISAIKTKSARPGTFYVGKHKKLEPDWWVQEVIRNCYEVLRGLTRSYEVLRGCYEGLVSAS